jgi:hypothetical protein
MVILGGRSKVKLITGTNVHTRRLGKIALKLFLSKRSTLYVGVKRTT